MLAHIIVCIITIIFFVYQYVRQKQIYQIYMACWAFSTFAVYLINSNILLKLFTIFQIVLGIGFIYFYFKARNYRKEQNRKMLKMSQYLNNMGVELYKDDIVD